VKTIGQAGESIFEIQLVEFVHRDESGAAPRLGSAMPLQQQ
jgi:hypothetical protein